MWWYLQLTDDIGHWHTTGEVCRVLFTGMKKPIHIGRWEYFKNFVRSFWKGFKKYKPRTVI